MLNFRKVVERGNGTANLNEDQANYEKKVGKLEKACENFGNYLKTVKSGTPFPKIIEAFEDKNKGFREQMEKNKLFSRTSKVLQEMRKNLSKFKKESFDPSKIDDYVRAFWFKAKKSNSKGYIKRSAIDDAQIVKFFTGKDPNTIPGILNAKKTSTGISASKTDLSLKESISRARQSFSQTQQTIATAKSTEKENQTAVETVKENPSINQPDKKTAVTRLTSQQNSLTSGVKASQKTSEQLASSISRSEKILSSPDATDNDKKQERKKLEATMETNNAQTQELREEIEQTKDVGNQVAADVANAENKTTNKNNENINKLFAALKEIKAKVQQTIGKEKFAEKRNKEIIESFSKNKKVDSKTRRKTISVLTGIRTNIKTNKQQLLKGMDELEKKIKTIKNNPNSPNNEQALNSATEQVKEVNVLMEEINQGMEKAEEIHGQAQVDVAQAENKSSAEELNQKMKEAKEWDDKLENIESSLYDIKENYDNEIITISKATEINDNKKKEVLDKLKQQQEELDRLIKTEKNESRDAHTIIKETKYFEGMSIEEIEKAIGSLENAITDEKKLIDLFEGKCTEANKIINKVLEDIEINEASLVVSRDGKKLRIITFSDFDDSRSLDNDVRNGIEHIVIINDDIGTINDTMFKNYSSLNKVDLNKVTTIHSEAFSGCSKLTDINLSEVKKINENAFKGCIGLKEVNLKSVETLGQDAFKDCTGLKKVTLPANEKKAAEIKNLILSQVGANVGKNINFINDSGKN